MATRRTSMPLRLAIVAALASAGVTAAASTAAATEPSGNNGTVKIDAVPFDNWPPNNEPHVTCEFEIQFFGFDEGQTADITLKGQPPSSEGNTFITVKEWNDVDISDDAAGGAANDPDVRIQVSADELDLSALEPHDKQGYHLKLIIDSPEGNKYKVFWLQPCVPSPSPTTASPSETTPPPTTPGSPGVTTPPGQLPVTGTTMGGLVALGVGLLGGGAALMIMRRRRDRVTFTS
jgi:LPXTG-motif cell wall-anchored protein